jgi:uncharacterized DUF497 family protein
LDVDWDSRKNRANQRKHGLSFDDAKAVFLDPYRIEVVDDREYDEERWTVIGAIGRIIVFVVYTERGSTLRLISARKADQYEEATYFRGLLE